MNPHLHSEEELLAHAAWAQGVVRAMVRDEHLAEDLVQDALEAGLRGSSSNIRNPRSWLLGVVRNLHKQEARSGARRRATEQRKPLPASQPSGEELLARLEVQQVVARAVMDLPDPFRSVLILRFYEGAPIRRIAALRKIDRRKAETQVHRGLELMRRQLRDRLGNAWALLVFPLAIPVGAATGALVGAAGAVSAHKGVLAAAGLLLVAGAALLRPPIEREAPAGQTLFTDAAVQGLPVAPVAGDPGAAAEVERVTLPARPPESAPADDALAGALAALRVRVIEDASGKPVPEVQVYADTPGGQVAMGATDADGVVEAEAIASWPAIFTTRSEGYAPGRQVFLDEVPRSIEIRVVPGGFVDGRVTFATGQPVPEGYRVVAFPLSSQTPDGELSRALRGEPSRLATTLTGAAGTFQLRGLSLETDYGLSAVGLGHLSARARSRATPGGSPVDLVVYPIYGALVRIRDEAGAIPRSGLNGSLISWELQEDWAFQSGGSWNPWLRHAVPQLATLSLGDFDQLMVAGLAEPPPAPLTLTVHCHQPGYAAAHEDVTLGLLGETIPEALVTLRTTAAEFGDLRLRFAAAPPGCTELRAPGFPLADLWLYDENDDFLHYEVRELHSGLVIPGIPAGHYRYNFATAEQRFQGERYFLGELDIRPGEQQLELDFRSFGSLDFRVREADGGLYWGRLQMLLTDATTGRKELVSFPGGPHRIALLPEGDYTARIVWPEIRGGDVARSAPFLVRAGETAVVPLVLLRD